MTRWLVPAVLAALAQDIEELSKNYNKEKKELVLWVKQEGGYSQDDKELNKKYLLLAVYGDGFVFRRSGSNFIKGQMTEDQMKDLIKSLLKEGMLTAGAPEGLPRMPDYFTNTIGIKLREKKNEIRLPDKIDDQLRQRPNDERLKALKKVWDIMNSYWPPNSSKGDPEKDLADRR